MSSSPREFSRLEYRRQDAWPERIRREGPFIASLLAEVPGRGWVVDVGCGTGEHARYLAGLGFPSIGVDRSRDAIAAAARTGGEGRTLWLRCDATRIPLASGLARLVLCLGNTLVILGEDEVILHALRESFRMLTRGGALLVQILNYDRLRSKKIRNLPLNFRPQEGGGELVYLRLLDFEEANHVSFQVITLERGSGEDAVRVRDAVRRRLRSLPGERLRELAEEAGFGKVRLMGDYEGSPFQPMESPDAILVARRS